MGSQRSPITWIEYTIELELEGEKRKHTLTWVKVNPACRSLPEVPLDFYILKVQDEKGAWLLI